MGSAFRWAQQEEAEAEGRVPPHTTGQQRREGGGDRSRARCRASAPRDPRPCGSRRLVLRGSGERASCGGTIRGLGVRHRLRGMAPSPAAHHGQCRPAKVGSLRRRRPAPCARPATRRRPVRGVRSCVPFSSGRTAERNASRSAPALCCPAALQGGPDPLTSAAHGSHQHLEAVASAGGPTRRHRLEPRRAPRRSRRDQAGPTPRRGRAARRWQGPSPRLRPTQLDWRDILAGCATGSHQAA